MSVLLRKEERVTLSAPMGFTAADDLAVIARMFHDAADALAVKAAPFIADGIAHTDKWVNLTVTIEPEGGPTSEWIDV